MSETHKENEMPKEIFAEIEKQEHCNLEVLEASFIEYEGRTKYIRFDEMERILNNNQSAFEANLKQKDEEIKMLKQQLNLKGIDMKDCKYLLVNAEVRYWDDATINGIYNEDGDLVPFKNGKMWEPIVDLELGKVVDWPIGTEAKFYFKVCDQGKYFLLDENKNKIAKYKDEYVPNEFLCHGGNGYGDYIVFDVNKEGFIEKYKKPKIDKEEWELI